MIENTKLQYQLNFYSKYIIEIIFVLIFNENQNQLHLTTNDSLDLRKILSTFCMAIRVKCSFCGQNLVGKGHLRRHLRTTHKEKESV